MVEPRNASLADFAVPGSVRLKLLAEVTVESRWSPRSFLILCREILLREVLLVELMGVV